METGLKANNYGVLPSEWPGLGPAIAYGWQIFISIFPATVLVPFLVGFNVSVTLFASGVATLAALAVNKFRIPLYYGSSFSAIAAVMAVVAANGKEGVSVAQVGIFVAGLAQVAVGYWIYKAGVEKVKRVLPPQVTGPVATSIAFALFGTALSMASGTCCLKDAQGQAIASGKWWFVALVTAVVGMVWSYRLKEKGLLGRLPILGAAVVGYLLAIPLGLVDFSPLSGVQVVRFPAITFPAFFHPGALGAILAIVPVVIATIPESLAHLFQIDAAVQQIGQRVSRIPESLSRLAGINQISDGIGDVLCGLFGGSMGTNYGEGIAVIVITGVATIWAVIFAAIFAVLASLSGHLEGLIATIPTAVVGGLAIYLFCSFGIVGWKMYAELDTEMLAPKNLAVASMIMTLAIGGMVYGGSLPIPLPAFLKSVLPGGVPAIAAGAFAGIILNQLLSWREK